MESSWKIRRNILSLQLSPASKLVAIALLEFRHTETGACFPSQKTLAQICGLTVKTVSRAIAELRRSGVVETKKTGRSCSYIFLPLPIMKYIEKWMDNFTVSDRTILPYHGPFEARIGENYEE